MISTCVAEVVELWRGVQGGETGGEEPQRVEEVYPGLFERDVVFYVFGEGDEIVKVFGNGMIIAPLEGVELYCRW